MAWKKTGQQISRSSSWSNEGQGSVLVPDMTDHWVSESTLSRDHGLVTETHGWQNVTLRSRMYREAHSRLNTE